MREGITGHGTGYAYLRNNALIGAENRMLAAPHGRGQWGWAVTAAGHPVGMQASVLKRGWVAGGWEFAPSQNAADNEQLDTVGAPHTRSEWCLRALLCRWLASIDARRVALA